MMYSDDNQIANLAQVDSLQTSTARINSESFYSARISSETGVHSHYIPLQCYHGHELSPNHGNHTHYISECTHPIYTR